MILDTNKKSKLIFLVVYVLAACFLLWFWQPVYIISIFVVLVPPAIINFLWLKESRKKVLIFSLAATLLFAPPVELMARLLNVWDVQSIFPRPFGLIPLENMLFAFLNFFWVLSFYEYFINHDSAAKINKRFRYLILLYILFSSSVFSLYSYNHSLVGAQYYVIALIVLVLPGILIFANNRKLLKKTIWPTLFFAVILFVYELVSLKIGSWFWPGQYLLSFKIFGAVFPLDDVIIWYFLSTPVLIGGYEYFADDYK